MSNLVCRLCAIEDSPSAFTDVFHHNTLHKMINNLLNVKIIKEENGTPICWECYRMTNEFHSFSGLVKKGQKKLKSIQRSQNGDSLINILSNPIVELKPEEKYVDSYHERKRSRIKRESDDGSSSYDEDVHADDERFEMDPIKNDEDDKFFEYPQMFSDGKIILSRTKLKELLRRFYKLECEICKTDFPRLIKLFQHYKSAHNAKGFVSCCGQKLYNKKRAIHHMGQHIQPSAYECPTCKKLLSHPMFLESHLRCHLPDDEKPFKCDQCTKSFASKEYLKTHKDTHIPLEQRDKYDCKICKKVFTLRSTLTSHVSMVHKIKDQICSECGKTFKNLHALKRHMMSHDRDGKYQTKCEVCGVTYKNIDSLKHHMVIHSGVLLECELCDYKSLRRSNITNHMLIWHSNDKPFECAVCKKLFKRKVTMEEHMRQHTGERKYSCPFCPKTFMSSGNFSKHKKRMHSEELKKIFENQ